MTDTNPAAGGLTWDEMDDLRDWWDEDETASVESAFPIINRIIAARTEAAPSEEAYMAQVQHARKHWLRAEAADRELARVTAAVEALADEWDALDMGTGLYPEDSAHRQAHEARAQQCAEDLRAALSSTDTTLDDLLDRERAKAAGEALRPVLALLAEWEAGPGPNPRWLNALRAAAVSPEGG